MSISRLAAWLESFGPFGLFLAAFLDAFVPLGHVVDPMVVYLSYRRNDPVTFAGLAVLGSTLGTTLFFFLLRRGAEALARRRAERSERPRLAAFVEHNGAAAVAIAAILPPPFPFKAVIVLAALGRMSILTFALSVLGARAFRYGLESVLAVLYGEWVLEFMKQHYPSVGAVVAALTVLGWWIVRRRSRDREPVAAAAAE